MLNMMRVQASCTQLETWSGDTLTSNDPVIH